MTISGRYARAVSRNATYYEGDLRIDLVRTALMVVREHGPAAVSLRALARTLGVSHAAPAHHFADKRALFTAIAVDGFTGLRAAFATALAELPSDAGVEEPLLAAGRAYLRFAAEHPAHFAVMWRDELLDQSDEGLRAVGDAALATLVSGVQQAQEAGFGARARTDDLAFLAWGAVHGLAVLWESGPLAEAAAGRFRVDVERAVTALLVSALAPDP